MRNPMTNAKVVELYDRIIKICNTILIRPGCQEDEETRRFMDDRVCIDAFLRDGRWQLVLAELKPVGGPTTKSFVIDMAGLMQEKPYFNYSAAKRVIKHLESLAVLDLMAEGS